MRLCPSCLRRLGDLRKKHTLEFWSMYLVDLSILSFFVDFGVHKVVPAQNDADGDGGGDEPTSVMPHSHR